MILVNDWRWPLTWKVRKGECPPYASWLAWHWHCLLPKGTT